MYTVNWNSYYFDRILQLRYAASVGQQTQKRYSYYFTCGNTIEKGPLLTYLDIMYTRQGLDQHGVISRLPRDSPDSLQYRVSIGHRRCGLPDSPALEPLCERCL